MPLDDLEYSQPYFSTEHLSNKKVIEDFWIPTLKESNFFYNGVGYFSSKSFESICAGLSTFLSKNEGKVRLIVGLFTENEDIESLKHGMKQKPNKDDFSSIKGYEQAKSDIENKYFEVTKKLDETNQWYFNLLSLLYASGRLEIKVALRPRGGSFHLKQSYFKDSFGNELTLLGSNNTSENAFDINSESFTYQSSWLHSSEKSQMAVLNKIRDDMNNMWEGINLKNSAIFDFPDACKDNLVKVAENLDRTEYSIEIEKKIIERKFKEQLIQEKKIQVPKLFKPRPYQETALKKWKEKGYRGILKHCTGAGKTLTSIYAATKTYLYNKEINRKTALIISVPKLDLSDQWIDDLVDFNWRPIKCDSENPKWESDLNLSLNGFRAGQKDNVCIIAVNLTFRSDSFQRKIAKLGNDCDVFFIGDECHNHKTLINDKKINPKYKYTLGLSATPEDENNFNEESDIVLDFYSGICHEYKIEDAIKDGWLTKFDYLPHKVVMDEEETNEWVRLNQLIAIAQESKDPKEKELAKVHGGALTRLLGRIKDKKNCLINLTKNVKKNDRSHTVFYSGEGTLLDDDETEEARIEAEIIKQIDDLSLALYDNGWSIKKYIGGDSRKIKAKMKEEFANKEFDALIAMKCMDEGINIPALKTAYITASTRKEKQYIQRTGRILRKDAGKDKSFINDFIIFPYEAKNNDSSLVKKEMERVKWFYNLCDNSDIIKNKINGWLKDYEDIEDFK